jgi:hypothetical protein
MKHVQARIVVTGLLLSLASTAGPGCQRDTSDFPSPAPAAGDGGLPGRVVSDAVVGAPRLVDGGPAREAGGLDAPAADAAPPSDGGPRAVTVVIERPTKDAVVPSREPFKPQVEVQLRLPPGANDAVKEVTATLSRSMLGAMPIASTKLVLVGQQTVPESGTIIYKYGDAPLVIPNAQSGPYYVSVTVTTIMGRDGSADERFLLDAGPQIRIDSPGDGKSFRGSAPLDVTILDMYFPPVKDVEAWVGPRKVALNGPGGASGTQYTATIDFSMFDPPLEGPAALTVRAKNRNDTEAVLVRRFFSDKSGPDITNTVPKRGALIGRVISIAAEVNDPAGVLDTSVVAVIAHGDQTYEARLQPPAPGAVNKAYTGTFDTSRLPINALFPTISFRAADLLGNESVVEYPVWLDNMPPIADLDPPNVRGLYKTSESNLLKCSWPFDPVGPDATDDGDIVPQLFELRARVEDQGNMPLTGRPDYVPVATIAEGGVKLLLMDDHTQPLVVNTNPPPPGMPDRGDGLCDALNPTIVPTTKPMSSKDALLITMVPFSPNGTFDSTSGDESTTAEMCTGGGVLTPADTICFTTQNLAKARYRFLPDKTELRSETLTVNMWYTGDRAPSLWGIPPYEYGLRNLLCGGTQFDALANNIQDGWACVAVMAQDKLGNAQVSRPLRVCIDKDGRGNECPHKAIARVRATTPIEVETVDAHGFTSGAQVKIQGVWLQTQANAVWTVQVIDPKRFTLTGSSGDPRLGDWPGMYPATQLPKSLGWAVRWSDLPNCTGTQTGMGPPAVIDGARSCAPWRLYSSKDMWLPP